MRKREEVDEWIYVFFVFIFMDLKERGKGKGKGTGESTERAREIARRVCVEFGHGGCGRAREKLKKGASWGPTEFVIRARKTTMPPQVFGEGEEDTRCEPEIVGGTLCGAPLAFLSFWLTLTERLNEWNESIRERKGMKEERKRVVLDNFVFFLFLFVTPLSKTPLSSASS